MELFDKYLLFNQLYISDTDHWEGSLCGEVITSDYRFLYIINSHLKLLEVQGLEIKILKSIHSNFICGEGTHLSGATPGMLGQPYVVAGLNAG